MSSLTSLRLPDREAISNDLSGNMGPALIWIISWTSIFLTTIFGEEKQPHTGQRTITQPIFGLAKGGLPLTHDGKDNSECRVGWTPRISHQNKQTSFNLIALQAILLFTREPVIPIST